MYVQCTYVRLVTECANCANLNRSVVSDVMTQGVKSTVLSIRFFTMAKDFSAVRPFSLC